MRRVRCFPVLAQRAALELREGHQTILLARGTHTMRQWSFDARSEGQSGDPLRNTGSLWTTDMEIVGRVQLGKILDRLTEQIERQRRSLKKRG